MSLDQPIQIVTLGITHTITETETVTNDRATMLLSELAQNTNLTVTWWAGATEGLPLTSLAILCGNAAYMASQMRDEPRAIELNREQPPDT